MTANPAAIPAPPGPARFRLEVPSGLRTPLRAAVAVAIAILIGHVFTLQRSYWAVLVAILLVNGTWGENTRKGLARLGMTLAGCAAAWGMHALASPHQSAEIAIMLGGIFLATYFRTTSYALMTFFVTVYVVFLFAIIGNSNTNILFVRSYETFIGCGVALLASVLVPPPRSTRQWEQQFRRLWESSRSAVQGAFDSLLEPRPKTPARDDLPHPAGDLLNQLQTLRAQFRAATYEGLFFGPSHRRRRDMMNKAKMLAHTALSLLEAVEALDESAAPALLRDELAALRDYVLGRFRTEADDAGAGAGCRTEDLDALQERIRSRAIALQRERLITAADTAWLGPIVYYSRQICRLIAG